ncbi:acetyl-CoA carboxylase biotin carboxyl carrier protein subunit [Bacillus weihaiensis]|uniref:Acetyl-CoA carboxylase biotin carboxyl carrier protein subunit n=1 Tax=Bacillus weihaiensis TaxID=1547283 RepID=A0A1L3MRA6_9BACI|nr:acetyl-CoA carboxylase biotin carboxyl carrier protein subunit [Bacillus weihaiensis]APH04842.1 acetyl-CoA carboxylase biotin carboxyl carrier protein subunit [Bacillus weihaiensis]
MQQQIYSNMAGSVWKITVKVGDVIKVGQEVVILESMKMEIPILSEYEGRVKTILIQETDFVNDGDILLELE